MQPLEEISTVAGFRQAASWSNLRGVVLVLSKQQSKFSPPFHIFNCLTLKLLSSPCWFILSLLLPPPPPPPYFLK